MTNNNNTVDHFIQRWRGADGSELANAQSFTRELCELLGVDVPDPARADTRDNAYVFERRVIFANADGSTAEGRIDCYRRGCFVMENKKFNKAEHSKGFTVGMLAAHKQAEQYVRALPVSEGRPPFIIVVDVGNVMELYAEFSCSGGNYTPFPNPSAHRIRLDDLRHENIRERLRTLWRDPMALDPTRQSAKVTREIAAQLAGIAKSLEAANYGAERVATFLTRCLFTFFSEDVGLLPKRSFTDLLETLVQSPDSFVPMVSELWQAMDVGKFSVALRINVLHFNGKLFKQQDVLPLNRDQIGLLMEAGRKDWSQVEPAIFGTLLERALNPEERHSLGAHFTPRAYVERLVLPTVIEPLREEWSNVQAAALTLASEGDVKNAEKLLREFQHRLCTVRVLDPACGSGNFLYVTLEHMKRLEGEVQNQLHDLNVSMSLETEGLTVDPHQFLGIELNPRAASIAEMVLWIGYLQWHFKTSGNSQPPQPVLRDFKNIENRDAVLAYDSVELLLDEHGKPVSRWDGKTFKKHPVTGEDVPDEKAQIAIERYINPRKAEWPEADFVVGNPPFIGNKRMRTALGDGYVEALRGAWADVPESADLVMFWWHHAADLTRAGKLKQFGLITTNSLKQAFNRRVLETHLNAKNPLSLVFAIPDHPWVDSAEGAAVRIAMTAAVAGNATGLLQVSTREIETGDGEISVDFHRKKGKLFADLNIGANVAAAVTLNSNRLISNRGVIPHGEGMLLTKEQAISVGFGKVEDLDKNIRPYRNGRDITQTPRDLLVIDLYPLNIADVLQKFPALYQYMLINVKPVRDQQKDKDLREKWWLHRRNNEDLRKSLFGLDRYIATVQTSKYRCFVFLDHQILPDDKLIAIASNDLCLLGVLSSALHSVWALATGATLEDRPVYNKSTCFEAFPFPEATEEQKTRIHNLAEQLDAHRKRQQAQHPELTLTGMYNVLEKLKTGDTLNTKEKAIHEQGLVSVLKQLHDELDLAVLDAYGWADLAPLMQIVTGNAPSPEKSRDDSKRQLDETLLQRLVDLNSQRADEEKQGLIRWLRPDYQNPQHDPLGAAHHSPYCAGGANLELDVEVEHESVAAIATEKQAWPKGDIEQVKAVAAVLANSKTALSLDALATHFTGKGPWKKRLPGIVDMLVAVGRAREKEGAYVAA
jgi:hypothetical protein